MFYYGGCPEPPAQSLLLPFHGDLHPPALPDASQLSEQRGQSPRHGSSIDAQGFCLQRCPGTRQSLGQSLFPWMGAISAAHFPAVPVLEGALCQAESGEWEELEQLSLFRA